MRTTWLPKGAEYGYDARVNPHLNRMLTRSFTGHKNYMRKLAELMGDAEAMKHFGNTMVVWDFHARKPLQTLAVPGAPLEIRWALHPRHEYAFTSTALTAKLWGVFRKPDGSFEAVEIGDVGDPAKTPLPVDISLSADDSTLFVDSFMDGTVRVYDVTNPRRARQIHEKKIGAQVNMVSQSWDGKRLYFTTSLLANWDGTGARRRAVPEGLRLGRQDARARPSRSTSAPSELGRPHQMNLGAELFRAARRAPAPIAARWAT